MATSWWVELKLGCSKDKEIKASEAVNYRVNIVAARYVTGTWLMTMTIMIVIIITIILITRLTR
jgi:hypothetical protein